MTYELITEHDSPNHSPRSDYGGAERPTGITIHHWGLPGQQFMNVVEYLCRAGGNTSAHVIVEDGRAAWIVDATRAAWHTGHTVGNGTTIGIECRPEATDGDYATVAEVIQDIRAEYGDIPLYPHSYWHNTACPGKYDLARLDRLSRTNFAPSTQEDDDDMALTNDQIETIARRAAAHVLEAEFKGNDGKPVRLGWLLASFHAMEAERIVKIADAVKKALGK